MDYEKLYKEALERAREKYTMFEGMKQGDVLEDVFPELRESEDERMRKALIKGFNECLDSSSYPKNAQKYWHGIAIDDIFAWLEKQGEKLPVGFYYVNSEGKKFYSDTFKYGNVTLHVEKQGEQEEPQVYETKDGEVVTYSETDGYKVVEPTFHEGDWIVLTAGELSTALQIVNVDINKKRYWFNDSSYLPIVDEECLRHWTIADAKDGDVLYHKAENGIEYIVMSKGLNENNNIDSYFRYNSINGFGIDIPSVLSAKCDSITPATKEQRDFLFEKMKEAGYEWDSKKKKLKLLITNGGDFELENCVQNPAWSEEDKNFMYDTLSNLTELKDRYGEGYGNVGKCIDWLKSLKDRYTWKPTDEQMDELENEYLKSIPKY